MLRKYPVGKQIRNCDGQAEGKGGMSTLNCRMIDAFHMVPPARGKRSSKSSQQNSSIDRSAKRRADTD